MGTGQISDGIKIAKTGIERYVPDSDLAREPLANSNRSGNSRPGQGHRAIKKFRGRLYRGKTIQHNYAGGKLRAVCLVKGKFQGTRGKFHVSFEEGRIAITIKRKIRIIPGRDFVLRPFPRHYWRIRILKVSPCPTILGRMEIEFEILSQIICPKNYSKIVNKQPSLRVPIS